MVKPEPMPVFEWDKSILGGKEKKIFVFDDDRASDIELHSSPNRAAVLPHDRRRIGLGQKNLRRIAPPNIYTPNVCRRARAARIIGHGIEHALVIEPFELIIYAAFFGKRRFLHVGKVEHVQLPKHAPVDIEALLVGDMFSIGRDRGTFDIFVQHLAGARGRIAENEVMFLIRGERAVKMIGVGRETRAPEVEILCLKSLTIARNAEALEIGDRFSGWRYR